MCTADGVFEAGSHERSENESVRVKGGFGVSCLLLKIRGTTACLFVDERDEESEEKMMVQTELIIAQAGS